MGCTSTREVFLQDAPKLEIAPAVKDCPDVNIADVKLSEGNHLNSFTTPTNRSFVFDTQLTLRTVNKSTGPKGKRFNTKATI